MATAAKVSKTVGVFMSGVLPLTDTPAAEKLSYAKTPRQPGPLTKSDSDRGPAAAHARQDNPARISMKFGLRRES